MILFLFFNNESPVVMYFISLFSLDCRKLSVKFDIDYMSSDPSSLHFSFFPLCGLDFKNFNKVALQ